MGEEGDEEKGKRGRKRGRRGKGGKGEERDEAWKWAGQREWKRQDDLSSDLSFAR